MTAIDAAAATEPPALSLAERVACEIASGVRTGDPSATAIVITAAKKDLNAKGNGSEWYRMVYRGGAWVYFAAGRLPRGTYLASDRRASVAGDVYEGEIVCRHHRGDQVDAVWLVVDGPRKGGERGFLASLEFTRGRDGLRVILPTGAHVTLPDPRR